MFTDILSYMNLTFTFFFSVECVLKLIAFGPGVRFINHAQMPLDISLFCAVTGRQKSGLLSALLRFDQNFFMVGNFLTLPYSLIIKVE
jgi:hypothetical protein